MIQEIINTIRIILACATAIAAICLLLFLVKDDLH